MKKTISFLMLAVLLLSLMSCSATSSKTLTGTWVYVHPYSVEPFPYYVTITFYSDNTCSISSYLASKLNCNYIVDNDQIKISADETVYFEGKLTKLSNELVIEEANSTTTMYKLESMDKKPTKSIKEEDFKDYQENDSLRDDLKITINSIGEIEHKDNKYYCTVNYSSTTILGITTETDYTFIWVPGLDMWYFEQWS